jgi:hypothetical protein
MVTTRQRHTLNLLWLSQARSWIRHQIPQLGSVIAGRPELQGGRVDSCIDIDPSMRNAAIGEAQSTCCCWFIPRSHPTYCSPCCWRVM